MWKFLFFAIILSVDAQKLKFDQVVREGVDISNLFEKEVPKEVFTYRLPNDTRPEQYLISLDFGDFHLGVMEFTGRVGITIRVVESTDTITLHSSVLLLSHDLRTREDIPIAHEVDVDAQREFLIVRTSTPLARDSVVRLTLNYRGSIGTSISGVYRESYLHNRDEKRCWLMSNAIRWISFILSFPSTQIFRRLAHATDVLPSRLTRIRWAALQILFLACASTQPTLRIDFECSTFGLADRVNIPLSTIARIFFRKSFSLILSIPRHFTAMRAER